MEEEVLGPELARDPKTGIPFPVLDGELLAWSPNGYMTLDEKWSGYLRARLVIRALKFYRPLEFDRCREELERDCWCPYFGHNARELLGLFDERQTGSE